MNYIWTIIWLAFVSFIYIDLLETLYMILVFICPTDCNNTQQGFEFSRLNFLLS